MLKILSVCTLFILTTPFPGFCDFSFEAGTSMGVHLQWSENTLRLAPGMGVHAVFGVDMFEIDGHLFCGAFFGNAVIISVQGYYIIKTGIIDPRIGLFLNGNLGSYMFFTESYSGSIRPMLPEFGFGIAVKPLVFYIDNVVISFLEFSVGTSFEYFGRILIAECELFKIGVLF